MFSDGQKIFAAIFIVAFVVIISFQFYKDAKKSKDLFKGTHWVIISLAAIVFGYIILVKVLH